MNLRSFYVVAAVAVVAMLAVSLWAWPQIAADAQVPIHWGLDGQPDGFAPKPVALLGMPALASGIGVLLAVVPRIEPRAENLARSAPAYRGIASGILIVLAVIHGAAVLYAVGQPVDIGAVVPLAIGALFVVIGNYLGKTRSTFLFGIRTPWTLTSERSWRRTHRLGGRLLMLLGVVVVAAAIVGVRGATLFALLGGGAGVFVVTLLVYSYLAWRDDPDRRPFGGPAGGSA